MSRAVNKDATQAAEAPPAPDTPTITHYEQVAANVSKAIDELLALIPNFVASHPSTKGFVRAQKSVSDDFLISAIAAVEESPELQALNQFDVTQARDALQFSQAFRPIKDKLNAGAANVGFSIDLRRANVISPALQAYDLIKGLARNPAGTTAASHAGNLKRDLGRSGKRRKKAGSAPAPTVPPVSAPATGSPVTPRENLKPGTTA